MIKRRSIVGGALLAIGIAAAVPASASSFGDAMSKCLVDKTSEADKTTLVQWVFSAISAGPAVEAMAKVTPAQRTELNKAVAHLMVRLLTVDCRAQTVDAIKLDGPQTIGSSFELLGKVAMQGMMTDPKVGAEMNQMTTFVDTAAVTKLFAEAGVPFSGQK